MKYNLNETTNETAKNTNLSSFAKFLKLIIEERKMMFLSVLAILINSTFSLLGPYLIGYTIDTYVMSRNYSGIITFSCILFGVYSIAFVFNYLQMRMMGGIGQRMLFRLRNAVFNKLQELPLDFFNQNKSGDLISRINNDTDKVNNFFSQSLVQFVGSIFTMIGSAIFLLIINWELGLAALIPAVVIIIFTKIVSPWVKKKNAASSKSAGDLSAEIQESLQNFKTIIAFNRRDFFQKRFEEVNQENYKTATSAGMANTMFMPVYSFAANLGQLIVLALGIFLITKGLFTIGLLISFFSYINNFYNPMRQLAALWASFQVAIASWDRIDHVLNLNSNLEIITAQEFTRECAHISFRNVSFSYPNEKEVLQDVSFNLHRGKKYAFVGPTGGGKTTTASLIARLYDATHGSILLYGKDIRTYTNEERAQQIGFILQEPFLFSGTVRENIIYGNKKYEKISSLELENAIHEAGLESLLERFENGLETIISASGDGISLGQKQLIAFMRVVLRKPSLLILDEATANIDTVTEKLLEEILQKLPKNTTRVTIAHRLNTIENADVIYFVNTGKITRAGSMQDAVNMLLNNDKNS